MALKVYKASLRLTIPIVEGGKVLRYVSFQDENNTFSTADEGVQKALESLPLFGRTFKLIRTIGGERKAGLTPPPPGKQVLNGEGGEPERQESRDGYTVYDEVADWQAAKEVLRNEPYNIPYQGLNSPDLILKKAEEMRVSFPNLNLN